MNKGRDEINWAPRLKKWKLRQLYQTDAQGILDEELLEEVGSILYQRCLSIFTVYEAKQGRVKCPACEKTGKETIIQRPQTSGDVRDVLLICPDCGWEISWGEYRKSFMRHQLNPGGAVKAFQYFLENYPRMHTQPEKMLLIDRLIHAFHFSFQDRPNLPTRPFAVNLIEGKLEDVLRFLDELSAIHLNITSYHDLQLEWKANLNKFNNEFRSNTDN
jgi:predicted RNA-binding Zn-ribbon protein involved in translation (DUF1610 family)